MGIVIGGWGTGWKRCGGGRAGDGNWEVIKQAKVDVRERHSNKGSIRQHDETIQTITTNKLEAVTTTLHLAEKPYAFYISRLYPQGAMQ